jgi:hypothetical protein
MFIHARGNSGNSGRCSVNCFKTWRQFNSFSKEISPVVEKFVTGIDCIVLPCDCSFWPAASYLLDHSSLVEISILCMLFLHLITKFLFAVAAGSVQNTKGCLKFSTFISYL